MSEDVTGALSKDARITNQLGLHARAAARVAEIARKAKANVWIVKNGDKADAASIIDILSLECAKGTRITIVIDDQKDTGVLDSIESLVSSGFGE